MKAYLYDNQPVRRKLTHHSHLDRTANPAKAHERTGMLTGFSPSHSRATSASPTTQARP